MLLGLVLNVWLVLVGVVLIGCGCLFIFFLFGVEVVKCVLVQVCGIVFGGYVVFQDIFYGLIGLLIGLLVILLGYLLVFFVGVFCVVLGIFVIFILFCCQVIVWFEIVVGNIVVFGMKGSCKCCWWLLGYSRSYSIRSRIIVFSVSCYGLVFYVCLVIGFFCGMVSVFWVWVICSINILFSSVRICVGFSVVCGVICQL